MNTPYHYTYIFGSLVAAIIASTGIYFESAILYGIVPGLIGGALAAVATVRFLKHNLDLAGFVATVCGFVFYQAFQANPVMLPEFTANLSVIAPTDQYVGIFLGNFTTGMLLLAFMAVSALFKSQLQRAVTRPQEANRDSIDPKLMVGFWVMFIVVAIPNVLFGQVVVGAYKNILYQRAAWSETGEFSGFTTWGGPVGASLLNMVFWSTSLFFFWIYLLGSRYRTLMFVLSPLVILWTASVVLQGSRTYLVTVGFGLLIYYLSDPKFGARTFVYAIIGGPLLFILLQIASFYRVEGLKSVDFRDLGERLFEIRGNEGTPSQMDGLEYFRMELLAKDALPNPLLGLVRGIFERPIEGILMPVPRALFPWKPLDDTARDYTLFYQNVRLGVPSAETFLGASPGMMGRELIRYGLFGPLTGLFWLGLVLAVADKLYSTACASAFHRITASVLVAFFVAQMRDWVPMWFLPFLPAMLIFAFVAWRVRKQSGGRRDSRISDRSPVHPVDFRRMR